VTVIDGTGAAPADDMTVVVVDGRIESVGKSAAVRLRPGTRITNLAGKFVIPGLIESHVHTAGPEEVLAPLYALTGVTTVREMRGETFHHEWRDKIQRGRLLGPRWVIGSPIIDGVPSLHTHDTGSLDEVATARQAREAVRSAKRSGADFIKVYSRLTPDAYLAITDEARRQGLPFAGHCPDRMTIARVSNLGHASIEHLHALLLATSNRESEIRRRLAKITIDGSQDSFHRYASWFRQVHPLEHEAVRSYQPGRADGLFRLLAARRTRVVPTLAVHRTLELPDDTPSRPEETKYLPTWMTEWWPDVTAVVVGGRTPEQARQIREIYAHRQRLVRRLTELGVPVLAGTDTGNPYLVPGYALHQELELLVESGLTPLQALRSATHEPAKLLGYDGSIGTVAVGKLADLVVLDKDPLRDIRNTRQIHAVVVRGRLIDHDERVRLLAAVEKAATDSRPPAQPATAAGCGCH
jgi:imidazolonepropionase-like amidohydrolase